MFSIQGTVDFEIFKMWDVKEILSVMLRESRYNAQKLLSSTPKTSIFKTRFHSPVN